MRRMILVTAAALLLAGCGGGDDEAGETAGAGTPAATVEAPAKTPEPDRCEKVPAELLSKLNGTMKNGATMKTAAAVRSKDFEKAWFVAGPLTGPGLDGKDDAVFVTNELNGPGLTFGVGGFAHQFSSLGHGEDTKAKFSQSDDGYDEAQDCA